MYVCVVTMPAFQHIIYIYDILTIIIYIYLSTCVYVCVIILFI